MSNEGSSSSSSDNSRTQATALNLSRIAGWSGPSRLKLGRARELWAKAIIRGALDVPPRLARIKKNIETGPSQPTAAKAKAALKVPNGENENSVVKESDAQELEHSEASTQPIQDLDARTSERVLATNPKPSGGAAAKSNGKKNEKETLTESVQDSTQGFAVPATRRSARLATKEVQNEDSSTPAATTTTNADTSDQPTSTTTVDSEQVTNTDVIDETKPAPRRSSRIKKVPAQTSSTPASNAGPSTKDVVEAVSAVVSTIKGPAPAPKSKPTRGQKRKRAGASEQEEDCKSDESGRSDGNAKKKLKDGIGTAKGTSTRKTKRARKSDKDEEGTTTQAGEKEKENTTESAHDDVPTNLALPQNGGEDENWKDGEEKKKLTIRVKPVKAVKKTRGSKKTRA
ncbi:hypothetical protein CC1G_03165 [Coprinopsis cinerea okayama7|uniref:Uncharacterized protein n=1 Tax=Coprinopsis cinerea (strain Okayama-7 / 130 / ATCC MYA-4618 / FGSC 9003) TaxID=240176 RepID=A8PF60_COPC7|nr:hypothetical protein CC1G_03165 [Coprinopsis cinerea okayama7\|eukprot:XP_001840936.2 hypothetical protein CC1G_03165 [Coprinopsis cinerea okayama7\